MIKLHHLNKSRSKRIIWLLEELKVPYEVVPYQRDSVTFLAPPELKNVHSLGKSPVIEDDGMVIIESGAMTEYLIGKYDESGQLSPEKGSADHAEYLQWMHFAEGSAMFPFLLKIFLIKDGAETNFLGDYAEQEATDIINYLEQSLEGKRYLVGDKLTGADIMMSFVIEIINNSGQLDQLPNTKAYSDQLATHALFHKANEIEAKY